MRKLCGWCVGVAGLLVSSVLFFQAGQQAASMKLYETGEAPYMLVERDDGTKRWVNRALEKARTEDAYMAEKP